MIPFEQLKVNDIFRFSYNADEGIIHGFGRVISIENITILCKDIFVENGKFCNYTYDLIDGYVILEIITNRESDLDIIKESYPEYFI